MSRIRVMMKAWVSVMNSVGKKSLESEMWNGSMSTKDW